MITINTCWIDPVLETTVGEGAIVFVACTVGAGVLVGALMGVLVGFDTGVETVPESNVNTNCGA